MAGKSPVLSEQFVEVASHDPLSSVEYTQKTDHHIIDTFLFPPLQYTPGHQNIFHTIVKQWNVKQRRIGEKCCQQNTEDLLKDLISSKLVSQETIMQDFCAFSSEADLQDIGKVLEPLLIVSLGRDDCSMVEILFELVVKNPAYFSILFMDAFDTSLTYQAKAKNLALLDVCLSKATQLSMCADLNNNQSESLLEMHLEMDETPLQAASRVHAHETVHMLLRHGAQIDAKWLGFDSVLEILLFSPLQSQVCSDETNAIKCLFHYASAIQGVNVPKLIAKEHDGYFPHISGYKEMLKALFQEPRTLLHLCRLKIRDSLLSNNQLPQGIRVLPLPKLLMDYIDLKLC